ncbi:hypothetical protein HDU77_002890 [Chytriomyces hyalinus]|nr:hypothetical protein HDU77_002890 [Chytriomyces hyalinus]
MNMKPFVLHIIVSKKSDEQIATAAANIKETQKQINERMIKLDMALDEGQVDVVQVSSKLEQERETGAAKRRGHTVPLVSNLVSLDAYWSPFAGLEKLALTIFWTRFWEAAPNVCQPPPVVANVEHVELDAVSAVEEDVEAGNKQ